ncbi:muscarinic acetylcholine receptor M5 [Latimeria chalumnae]|uniref:Muscarinic acetylcholine receptor n=1 Tax=Latimeria chalumnae TaxID=7897 RepID=H3AL17_LATCH|nr:PREDICTED: muscarinic acetylcholine receptor M5 [Latimeria chalumnae]|eukprot:XP_006001205.1 PREDICTED: muscarinic acetylcholine receptor M5 [Latimeria chalumnae]
MEPGMLENSAVASGNTSTDPLLEGYTLWEIITIATVTAIVSFITIIGNLLVIVSFKVNSQLKTVNNYYLLSLAFADLIIGIFSMNLYTPYILLGHWSLGSLACDLWLAMDYVASNASVMNLLVISFDRYFSITRPLTYRAKRTPKRAGILIGLAWFISLILWAPAILCWQYFVGKRTVLPGECHIQFLSEPVITFGTAIAAFYIPVSVMTVLYWRIYKETEKRTKDLAELQGSGSRTDHKAAQPKNALLKSCFSFKQKKHSVRERCQNSWSSSSRSTSATAKATQSQDACDEWAESNQGNTFRRFPSTDNENRHSTSSIFQVAFNNRTTDNSEDFPDKDNKKTFIEDHPLMSNYKSGNYFVSPMKCHIQKSNKYVSYKFKLAAQNEGPEGTNNGCTQMIFSPCSATESEEDPSIKTMDLTLSNQITKRKRMVLIKEKKAAQTLSAILLAFIVTWTPYNIMVLVSTFCSDCIPVSLWHLGYWLCYVNSTVNPICYALCNKTFRKTFKMLLMCQWKKKRVEEKLQWYGQHPVSQNKLP